MSNLSDDDIAEVIGDGTCTHLPQVRMALEIREHRVAVAARAERVEMVVHEILNVVLTEEEPRWSIAKHQKVCQRIAARAAEQLATAATCDNVVAFSDGELSPEQADVFRKHLPSCEACRRSLTECVQLSAQLSELNGAPR